MIYELLEATTSVDLSKMVRQRLAEGWTLYGNPVVTMVTNQNHQGNTFNIAWFHQAVIKQENNAAPSPHPFVVR